VHELAPYAKTICVKTGGVKGEYRKPQIRKAWGEGTETIHHEHGAQFKMDVTKVMWAKGNINERKRIASLVKKNEFIIDFFSGIGYFSILIGMYSNPKKLISIEKNPTAFHYLKENIRLNKLEEIITPILGDTQIIALNYKNKADRIIMGLLPAPKEFIEVAIKALKQKGIIHYEGITELDKEENLLNDFIIPCNKLKCKYKLLNLQKIKSYSPRKVHIRIDVLIEK
jgi:tRNA wybutosine-synthesizing protein 2